VQGGADALASLESGQWDVLFLDRRLRDLDAEELVAIIKIRFPGIEVVLLDSGGDFSQLGGAFGGPESNGMMHQVQVLVPADADTKALPGMIGRASAMQRLYRLTRLVAPRTTTVLVLGATGTGKELVARAIHQLSPRAARTCVVVNCAAIPEALLEAELFGYVRGAFTGAVQTYAGRIYAAQGGTLFLDEIGELPIALQAKLLRFLEQKEVQRLGSSEAVKVDVRVVAATNADLPRQVERGAFREDLY
jgi:transcriptional regulator with GAF, ATPase, and Fis domain